MSWRKVTTRARVPRFRLTVEGLDHTPPPLRLETFRWQDLLKSGLIGAPASFRPFFARNAVMEWLQARDPQQAADLFVLWTFGVRRSLPQTKSMAAELSRQIVEDPRRTLATATVEHEHSIWGTVSMLASLFPTRFDPPPPLRHARLRLDALSATAMLVTRHDFPFVRTTFVANLLSEVDPTSKLAQQLAPRSMSPAFLLWYVEIGRWIGRPAHVVIDVYAPSRWLEHLRRGQVSDLRTRLNSQFVQ